MVDGTEYMTKQYRVKERFWGGFGLARCPDFTGKTVLELGCGPGNRCIEAVDHGAKRVVGLDTSDADFSIGRRLLAEGPPQWSECATFFHGTLDSLPPERFDVIISEDTFEHVMDLPDLLDQIRKRLKPRGQLFVGFGPLYHSPEGDHGWMRDVLPGRRLFPWPWGHLLLEHTAFRRLSIIHGTKVQQTFNWPYLDLNQHTVDEFETIFRASGLTVKYLKTNCVHSIKAKLFTSFAKIPPLRSYFTLNIFAILESSSGDV